MSAVGAATNEHVLTKDTGTGNAIWKAAAGGGGADQDTSPIYWNMITTVPDVVGQGTWTITLHGSYPYNGFLINTSNGDNITLNFYAPAGTYELNFNNPLGSNRGIVDIDIDAVEKGSFDGYAAANNFINISQLTGIVIGTSGAHTLKFRIDGKNGSSTAYLILLSGIHLLRTA